MSHLGQVRNGSEDGVGDREILSRCQQMHKWNFIHSCKESMAFTFWLHKTHWCLLALSSDHLYWISPEVDNECEKYRGILIYTHKSNVAFTVLIFTFTAALHCFVNTCYVGGPKRNQKRSLVGGSIVVHASAARHLLRGPFCISLQTDSVVPRSKFFC